MSMPVSSYEPKNKLTIKFMTEDPVGYMGIVVMSAGTEVTIHTGWDKLKTCRNKKDESNSPARGTVYTISKNSKTNIYTLTFNFTEAEKEEKTGKAFWEKAITNIGFYLGDPNKTPEEWEGTRTIKFISVEFSED